jgi:putative protease
MNAKDIEEGLEKLRIVYNRGFSSGFYIGSPTPDDFSKSEDGEAKERKEIVGEIIKYWPKAGVAAVKLSALGVSIGDELYVCGNESGIMRVKVKSIEVNNKSISSGEKGTTVGIKIPKCRKGDTVYKIVKNE